MIEETLKQADEVKTVANYIKMAPDAFFIGRGLDYTLSLEGALKLKEISYVHAEAYAAGELKHGTIALITENVPVIALATQESVYGKMISIYARLRQEAHTSFLSAWMKSTMIKMYVTNTYPYQSRMDCSRYFRLLSSCSL